MSRKILTFVKYTMLCRIRYFWIICLFLFGLNSCVTSALVETLDKKAPLYKPLYQTSKKQPNHLAQILKNGDILINVFLEKIEKGPSKISFCFKYKALASSFKNGLSRKSRVLMNSERILPEHLCDTKDSITPLAGKRGLNVLVLDELGIMIDLSRHNGAKTKRKILSPSFSAYSMGSRFIAGEIGEPGRVFLDQKKNIYIMDRRGSYITLVNTGKNSKYIYRGKSQQNRRPRFSGTAEELPFKRIGKSILLSLQIVGRNGKMHYLIPGNKLPEKIRRLIGAKAFYPKYRIIMPVKLQAGAVGIRVLLIPLFLGAVAADIISGPFQLGWKLYLYVAFKFSGPYILVK